MQRVLTTIFALALLLLAGGVALDINVAQNRAFNLRSGGADPGVEELVMGVSTLAVLGALLLVVGAILSLVQAVRRHQWGWLVVLLALLPAGLYAFAKAGFEADVLAGLLSLVAPVAYLLFTLIAWPASGSRKQQG